MLFCFNVLCHFNSTRNPKFENSEYLLKFEHYGPDVNNDVLEISDCLPLFKKDLYPTG